MSEKSSFKEKVKGREFFWAIGFIALALVGIDILEN